MKKVFFLVLMIGMMGVKGYGQFYKSFDVNTESQFSNLSGMVLTFDSSYVIASNSFDSATMNHTIELIKIDTGGNFVWRQSFECGTELCINTQIAQTPDSGFVISASYMDTTYKILLIKTNNLGIKQWIELLEGNNISQTNSDIKVKDNNIYSISFSSNSYLISKLDFSGNLVWYKSYNWAGNPYPKTMIITNSHEIYVAGEVVDHGYAYFGLSEIDSSGNILFSRMYLPQNDIQPFKIIIDSNGDLILTGHIWVTNHQWDIFLEKFDALGNFKWGKSFGGIQCDEGWNLFLTQNGFMILAEPESFGSSDISRATLIQTDTAGNLQWMKIYGDTTGSFPNGAVQINNGFVIYGINGSYYSNVPFYLMKTDNNGISSCKWSSVTLPDSTFNLTSLDSGSSGIVQGIMTFDLVENSTSINEYNECLGEGVPEIKPQQNISLYPNPTAGTITFSLLGNRNFELGIYDVLGQEVYHQAINNSSQSTINISQLSNGVYFYSLSNNTETLRGKIVKQ